MEKVDSLLALKNSLTEFSLSSMSGLLTSDIKNVYRMVLLTDSYGHNEGQQTYNISFPAHFVIILTALRFFLQETLSTSLLPCHCQPILHKKPSLTLSLMGRSGLFASDNSSSCLTYRTLFLLWDQNNEMIYGRASCMRNAQLANKKVKYGREG